MKDLAKEGLDLLEIYNKDDAVNFILKVANQNGYATTATRIKFK
jgi:hypothetical protein